MTNEKGKGIGKVIGYGIEKGVKGFSWNRTHKWKGTYIKKKLGNSMEKPFHLVVWNSSILRGNNLLV